MIYKYHQAINIYNGKIVEEFRTQNTKFEVVQGKISAIISDEELKILQNGSQTWYDKYTSFEATAGRVHTRVSELDTLVTTNDPNENGSVVQRLENKAADIKQETDGIFASIVDVLMAMNDATATTPTTKTVTIDNHDFNITARNFESRISHMETITSGSLGDEATILEWAQSAIQQSARNITLSVQSFAVTDVVIEYAVGTSRTTAPTTGWSTATPTWEQGKYIWQRTGKIVDGRTTYSNVVCIQGAQGAQGPQGSEGARGQTGKGIKSTKTQYILADFNVLPTPDYTFTPRRWYDTPEEYMTQDGEPRSAMKYYWTRVKTEWTDNSVTYSDPVYDATISDASKWSYEASIVLADSSITAKVEAAIADSDTVLKRAELSLGIDSGQSYFKVRADSIDLHGIVTANGGFRIDSNGTMSCTGANIYGSVYSYNGSIGGLEIGSNYIYTNGIVFENTGTIGIGVYKTNATWSNRNNPPLKIYSGGTGSGTISGTGANGYFVNLAAGSGTPGGTHTFQAGSSGVYVNNGDIRNSECWNTDLTGTTKVNNLTAYDGDMITYGSDGLTLHYYPQSSKKIKDLDRVLVADDVNKLYDLPVWKAKYKDGYLSKDDPSNGVYMPMLVAEEVAELFPEMARYDDNGDVCNWKERVIIPAMLQLIKDQKSRIDALETKIEKLSK